MAPRAQRWAVAPGRDRGQQLEGVVALQGGHSFQAQVVRRAGGHDPECPYCSGRKVLSGFNELATV